MAGEEVASNAESPEETLDGLRALLLRQEAHINSLQDENARLLAQARMAAPALDSVIVEDLSKARLAVLTFVNRIAAVSGGNKILQAACMGGPDVAVRDIMAFLEYGNGLLIKLAVKAASPRIIV